MKIAALFPVLALLFCAWAPGATAPQTPPFEAGEPIAARAVEFTDVALFDYDEDGDLDLIHTEPFEKRLVWQENLGNHSMGVVRPVDLPLGHPVAVRAFDYLADGRDELLVVDQVAPSNLLLVLSRVPGGGLQVLSTSVIPGSGNAYGASTLEVADADGDGDLDAVISSHDFSLFVQAYVAFQDPQGAFTFVRPNPTAPFGTEFTVALADVTGNGLSDVIVRVDVSDLGYAPQVSPGVFGPSVVIGEAFGNGPPEDIAAVDFDNDGDLDVVATFEDLHFLYLYENRNGNSFKPRVEIPVGGSGFRWLDPFDMDGDGDTDLLVATNAAEVGSLTWLENTGGVDLQFRDSWTSAASSHPFVLTTLRDWDNDGLDDLFTVRDEGPAGIQATVHRGQPTGGSALAFDPQPSRVTDPLNDLKDVTALDVDGDGDLDLLTASRFGRTTVALNIGPGRFERPIPLIGAPVDGRFFATGDIDADGRVDGVLSTQAGRLFWMRNRHDGIMVPTQLGLTSATFNDRPALADVDGDGDLDVVAVTPAGNELYWYEQTSPGAFAPGESYLAVGSPLVDFEIADMDADGALDLTVITAFTSSSRRVVWYRGLGGMIFDPPATLDAGSYEGENLRVADIDGTGTPDLLWYRPFSREVVSILGLAGGTFSQAAVLVNITGRGRCMEVSPAPGGGVDLAVGTQRPSAAFKDRVEWFRATGGGSYAPTQGVDEEIRLPRSLLVADLDQDGDVDLVSTEEDGGRIRWYPGRTVPEIGDRFCSAATVNSTGRIGRIAAVGSDVALSNELRLVARDLRADVVTLFLASQTQASVPMAGGSAGTLCLGGNVGRFLQPGQAGLTNADGLRDLTVDLTLIPQPVGFASVTAGETWSFQAWHRDLLGGAVTSNFTDAIAVSFL